MWNSSPIKNSIVEAKEQWMEAAVASNLSRGYES
jgi:hypothetical protein